MSNLVKKGTQLGPNKDGSNVKETTWLVRAHGETSSHFSFSSSLNPSGDPRCPPAAGHAPPHVSTRV